MISFLTTQQSHQDYPHTSEKKKKTPHSFMAMENPGSLSNWAIVQWGKNTFPISRQYVRTHIYMESGYLAVECSHPLPCTSTVTGGGNMVTVESWVLESNPTLLCGLRHVLNL